MRVTRYRGLLVVMLWQSVPVTTQTDSTGSTRLSVGFGGGQYEATQFDCDGNLVDVARVPYGSAGALIEYRNGKWRVAGFGGGTASDSIGGVTLGGVAAFETRWVGVGAGAMTRPTPEGQEAVPSLYLRAGNAEAVHARIEVMPPVAVYGTTGNVRIGIAGNQGRERGTSWFVGLAPCHICLDDREKTSAFVDLAVPIGQRLDLELRALAGEGYDSPNLAGGLGLRFTLGR